MYQSLSIRQGKSSSSALEKAMAGFRSVGSVPGILASSTLSCSSVSDFSGLPLGEKGGSGTAAVGTLGCEILFCPVMTVPSVKPAAMWQAKLVLRTGKTDIVDGTPQMLDSK